MTTPVLSSKGISFRLLGFPVLYRWSALALPTYFFVMLRTGVRDPLDAVGLYLGLTLGIGAAVLVHELGHALTARHYGGEARIELVLLGGLTQHAYDRPLSNTGKIMVSAAGTLAGLAVGVPILWVLGFDLPSGGPWTIGLNLFVIASVVWGVFNLLPLPGLDGSHILDAVVRRVWPGRAGLVVPVVTSFTAVVAIVGIYLWQGPFAAFWLVLIFGPELFNLADRLRSGRDEPLYEQAAAAEAAYRAGDLEAAERLARDVADQAASEQLRGPMQRIRLLALMNGGRYHEALELEAAGARLPALVRARALMGTGRLAEAEAALRSVDPDPDAEALLAEVLVLQDLDHRVPEVLGAAGASRLVDRALELEAADGDRAVRLARIVVGLPGSRPVDRARASLIAGLEPDVEGLSDTDRWLVEAEAAGRRGAVPALDSGPEDVARTLQDRLHHSGHAQEAVEVARRIGEGLDAGGHVMLARSLVRVGDTDGAFAALQAAAAGGFRDAAGLVSDPALVPLRGDPRWDEVLSLVGGRRTR